jgi:hypothetical protein
VEPTWAIPGAMANEQGAIAWLNGLSSSDADRIWKFIRLNSAAEFTDNSSVPGDLSGYQQLNHEASEKSGEEWRVHNTCLHLTRGQGLLFGQRYTRYQLQFKSAVGVVTPQKVSAILYRLKRELSVQAWEGLKALASANESRKVTFTLHHIAYTWQRTKVPGLPPIPLNAGSGGSVAHLCDNACQEPAHLFVTPVHGDNINMRNCLGPTILVKEGVILQTVHCPHYSTDAEGVVTIPDCAKVRVIQLSECVHVSPSFEAEFHAAREAYLAADPTA